MSIFSKLNNIFALSGLTGKKIALLIFFSLSVSFLDVLGIYIVALLIDKLLTGNNHEVFEIIRMVFGRDVNVYYVIFFFLCIRGLVYIFLQRYTFLQCFQSFEYISKNLVSRVFSESSFLEKNSRQQVTKLAAHDLLIYVNQGLSSSFRLISDSLIIFFILIFLVIENTQNFVLLLAFFGLFVFLLLKIFRRRVNVISENLSQQYKRIIARLTDIISARDEIINYNLEKKYFDSLVSDEKQYAGNYANFNTFTVTIRPILEFIILFGLLTFLLLNTVSDKVDLSGLSFIAFSIVRLLPIINQIFQNVANINFASAPVEGLMNVAHFDDSINVDLSLDKDKRLIDIDEIKLSISSKTSNSQFRLKKGDVLCITGKSGIGKTTMVRKALNLTTFEPNFVMELTSNNKSFDKEIIHSIGYLPQKPYIFSAKLIENIVLYKEVSSETVNEYLDKFGLESLKSRIQDKISNDHPKLSVGQIQRLGIIRALLLKKSIIFLDEPTSALSRKDIDIFLELLNKLRTELIFVIISHDSEIVQQATYEVNLDNI